MIPIAKVVKSIVENRLLLQDALMQDIANLTGVARYIQPEVQAKLLEEVSISSIVMALRRIQKTMKVRHPDANWLYRMRDLTVRSQLTEFIVYEPLDPVDLHKQVIAVTNSSKGSFVNISHGLREMIIVVPYISAERVSKLLEDERKVEQFTDLAAITLRLPHDSILEVGVYYPILQALYWHNIPFVEIVSIGTELNFFFEEKDVSRAFEVLQRVTTPQNTKSHLT